MELEIDRIQRADPRSSHSPAHPARLVVSPDDFAATSPFLLMAEDWFAPPAGFPDHPHRGMQTVTIVLEGGLEHRDHTGAHGVLEAGDVQWMSAGRIEGDDTPVKDEDVVWFKPVPAGGERGILGLEADIELRALLFAGPTIDEPVVAHGPFVMNTIEEIRQAYSDYRLGRLTEAPRASAR